MHRHSLLGAAAILAAAGAANAQVLITEVLPGVVTNATAGDTVELFNAGGAAVDLTDWVLTDLDPGSVESSLPSEGTFAPASLALPALQPGDFAVVVFADSATGTAGFVATNYGVRIVAPLATGGSSFLDVAIEQVVLLDDGGAGIDSVAWGVSTSIPTTDQLEDLEALTPPTAAFGLVQGGAAWAGDDDISTTPQHVASAIDFLGLDAASTYGQGALRRRSTNGVFDVGSPDGAAQWEAVPRHQATLGNASDDVATVDGIRPIRATENAATWLTLAESSTFPERRVATGEDQSPADFVPPTIGEMAAWEDVLVHAMAGEWEQAFADADPLGYEVVELLDTASGETFHVLRNRTIPGQAGFTGQGIFVFGDAAQTRDYLVLEVPHPRADSNTLGEGALALGQVFPRVMMVAGTHRDNHTTDSTCDGEQTNGTTYRISDVAHHPDNFFHTTHKWLFANLPNMVAIQFHGFCCPGSGSHPTVTHDCIVAHSADDVPPVATLPYLWRTRIDAQNFLADDGSPGGDLTDAGIYNVDESELGARNNLQGRIMNGVTVGDECDTEALASTGRFVHIEQDPDVREEPQHIVTALVEALDLLEAGLPVELDGYAVE